MANPEINKETNKIEQAIEPGFSPAPQFGQEYGQGPWPEQSSPEQQSRQAQSELADHQAKNLEVPANIPAQSVEPREIPNNNNLNTLVNKPSVETRQQVREMIDKSAHDAVDAIFGDTQE